MKKLTRHHISFLKQLKKLGFTSAIIAGGAIRDTYFERDISDVDIYINSADLPHLSLQDISDLLHNKLSSNPYSFNRLFEKQDGIEYSNSHMKTIWEYVDEEDVYQIMLLDEIEPVQFIENYFDLGICMAYCDGEQHHFMGEFLHDADNKTITVRGNLTESELAYSVDNHLPKVEQKYPQHRTVISQHLQQYLSAASRGELYAGSN